MEAIMTSNLPIFFKYLKRISFSIFFGIELKVPKFPRFTKMHFFTGEREKTSRWSIEYGERERERASTWRNQSLQDTKFICKVKKIFHKCH
jgi:hypothetical protein